jgi:hypothetical protein
VICEQCWQVEYTNKEVLTRGERGRLERLWSAFGLGFGSGSPQGWGSIGESHVDGFWPLMKFNSEKV